MTGTSFFFVRITGLEPARRGHQNLNLARLPIPPYPPVASLSALLFTVYRSTGQKSMKNIFKFLLTNKLHGAMVNYTSNEPHN